MATASAYRRLIGGYVMTYLILIVIAIVLVSIPSQVRKDKK